MIKIRDDWFWASAWAAASAPFLWWVLQPRVELRTWVEYRDGRVVKGADVREWTLDIPRRFPIARYHVFTQPAFDPTVRPAENQFISLNNASLDPSDTIVPGRDKGRNRQFSISLNNKPLEQKDRPGRGLLSQGRRHLCAGRGRQPLSLVNQMPPR